MASKPAAGADPQATGKLRGDLSQESVEERHLFALQHADDRVDVKKILNSAERGGRGVDQWSGQVYAWGMYCNEAARNDQPSTPNRFGLGFILLVFVAAGLAPDVLAQRAGQTPP